MVKAFVKLWAASRVVAFVGCDIATASRERLTHFTATSILTAPLRAEVEAKAKSFKQHKASNWEQDGRKVREQLGHGNSAHLSRQAKRRASNGEAQGPDCNPEEFLKVFGKTYHRLLAGGCQAILTSLPLSWRAGAAVSIRRKPKAPLVEQYSVRLLVQRGKKSVGQSHDNDNDNDTLREVPHPSNEGLALQARV